MAGKELVSTDGIQSHIYSIRGLQVMLDSDLAVLYGVKIKRLNEQVKRNIERFPQEFMFQLSGIDVDFLRSQFATLENTKSVKSPFMTSNGGRGKYRKYLPYPTVEIQEFKNSHDRFIIIDGSTVYHFGASLKDLGKKWFAFSKMEIGAVEMLGKLEVKG